VLAACLVAVAALSATAANAAAPTWSTYFVLHQPLSLALPDSWSTLASTEGDSFNAGSGEGGAYAQVFVNRNEGATQAQYFAGIQVAARNTYLEQDPKAVIRVRTMTLPAGKTLEVIAQLTRIESAQPLHLWIQNYNFFYKGLGYDVLFECPSPEDTTFLPVFRAIVQTMRFGGLPAVPPGHLTV
jgi:hypothetical protein